jgi:hypothetical protein
MQHQSLTGEKVHFANYLGNKASLAPLTGASNDRKECD